MTKPAKGRQSDIPAVLRSSDLGLVASCIRSVCLPSTGLELTRRDAVVDDIVVGRITSIGGYPVIEDRAGAEQPLCPGDLVTVAMGNRLSTTSYFGKIGDAGIPVGSEIDLLSAGGIAGIAEGAPRYLAEPTRLRLLGVLATADHAVVRAGATAPLSAEPLRVPVLLVVGTAAEVGKTTFASSLVEHLAMRGVRVAATKLTGTGRLRDLLAMKKAGAHAAADFVDAGLPTTYCRTSDTVRAAARSLVRRLAESGAEFVVAECGGDLIGGGVPDLLTDPVLQACCVGVVIVPSDVVASYGAEHWLLQTAPGLPRLHAHPPRNPAATRDRMSQIMPAAAPAVSPADLVEWCLGHAGVASMPEGTSRR